MPHTILACCLLHVKSATPEDYGTLHCLQPAQPVPEDMLGSGELIEIVSDMFAEMRAAPGVGLAAPQIGLDMQVAALNSLARQDMHTSHSCLQRSREHGR